MPNDGEQPDSDNLEPLFATLLATIPAPTFVEGAPLQAHVTNLDASPYLGRLALCRVHEAAFARVSRLRGFDRTAVSIAPKSSNCS